MSGLELILAGAAPDTGNLGVSALCYSTVANILKQREDAHINILGHGSHKTTEQFAVNGNQTCDVVAAKHTRRFYDPSAFINIRYSIKLGPLASKTAKMFRNANALLDISGGDSFTDLYGKRRFEAIVLPKIIAVENNIPLVLLPQTYGPFVEGGEPRAVAQDLIRRSRLAYARDQYSFEYMQELLGGDFNPEVHKQGVDVAFLLPAASKEQVDAKGLTPPREPSTEVFGINVSGLIYNDPENAKSQYGIKVDYHKLLKTFIEHVLNQSAGDVWLVPHVHAPYGHYESDLSACEKLKSHFSESQQQRIKVVNGDYDQCEIKGVIGQCDWFTGTRMHSTVGSLSQAVPTAAIAYSGKTRGVFATAGQEAMVFDARQETTENLLDQLINSWALRSKTKEELERDIPLLKQRAHRQFEEIVSSISR
ncbi:MAG: polysaccharide pyruvyl transferase family protein [Pseudomonadota bacterium]|nr:polysaccharide pyruvyl transferase family protein [Pseudomonadota bacterium]